MVYKLFPDITLRNITPPPATGPTGTPTGTTTGTGPTGTGSAGKPITLKDALKDLFTAIKLTSPSPEATLNEIVKKLNDKDFEMLKKVGYFLPAATTLAVETGVKLATILSVGPPAGVIYYVVYKGVPYAVNNALIPLIQTVWKFLKEMPLKRSFGKLYDAIKKAIDSKLPGDKYLIAFNNLDSKIQAALSGIGYDPSTDSFKALVDSLGGAIIEKKRCDEKEFLETLTSGNDRYNLKLKLEGLLKKLDLNTEDEFLKFQKKVIETLTNQFSLFSKFQQKVIDELYKIGIPQIKEVDPDFFQILNDDNTETSEHKVNLREMRNIYADFNYDNI